MNNHRVKELNKVKKILPSIIDSVILCGHLGIPLRGHRDDKRYHPEPGEYSKEAGLGNFLELLNFAIRRGDKDLEEHYKNHPKNSSYFSKTVQNEIINICGDIIVEDIVADVKWNPDYFFSIIADEALDSSTKEQLSLVLRFVDKDSEIREEFVGFVHLKDGLTGKHIAEAICKKLEELKLDISRCRGQGYDGAGAVAGVKNGAAAHILALNQLALYFHCFSHKLSLAVSKNFKIISVSNMLETVQKISHFFQNSEQRQRNFEQRVQKFCASSRSQKLRDPCKTRWVERIKDLDIFIALFEPLWVTLEDMKANLDNEFNRNTQSDAFSFFKAIDDFDFIVTLVITYEVLKLSLDVTELLQSKENDIADGLGMITSLFNTIKAKRAKIDDFHEKCFEKASSIASKLNIPVSKPRTNNRQVYRENHQTDSIGDYYRVSLTIPLLDTLEQELASRFYNESLACYSGIYLIPSKIVSMENSPKLKGKTLRELYEPLINFYHRDLPDPERARDELDVWQDYWLNVEKDISPTNFSDTLKSVNFTGFKNIKVLLRIMGILPLTSCECERTFSGMKR